METRTITQTFMALLDRLSFSPDDASQLEDEACGLARRIDYDEFYAACGEQDQPCYAKVILRLAKLELHKIVISCGGSQRMGSLFQQLYPNQDDAEREKGLFELRILWDNFNRKQETHSQLLLNILEKIYLELMEGATATFLIPLREAARDLAATVDPSELIETCREQNFFFTLVVDEQALDALMRRPPPATFHQCPLLLEASIFCVPEVVKKLLADGVTVHLTDNIIDAILARLVSIEEHSESLMKHYFRSKREQLDIILKMLFDHHPALEFSPYAQELYIKLRGREAFDNLCSSWSPEKHARYTAEERESVRTALLLAARGRRTAECGQRHPTSELARTPRELQFLCFEFATPRIRSEQIAKPAAESISVKKGPL